MSNIATDINQIKETKILDYAQELSLNINKKNIMNVVDILRGLSSTNFKVNIRDNSFVVAQFLPQNYTLEVSISKIENWISINTPVFYSDKICTMEELRKYMLLLVLSHEIEHAIQYEIAYNIRDTNIPMLKKSYLGIYKLFEHDDDTILPHLIRDSHRHLSLILYKIKENDYLLERNANIETFDFLSKLAISDGNESLADSFQDYSKLFKHLGYINNNEGSIKETYKNTLMIDKYNKFKTNTDSLTDEEKARYGFTITSEAKKLVLNKK